MRIILGSQSTGRQKILSQMGYEFEVMNPDIDEKSIRRRDPAALTLALAIAKSNALLPQITEEAILITSDQVVVYNGKVREKPVSSVEALFYLSTYSAFHAQTVTSVLVTNTKTRRSVSFTDTATIHFSSIPTETMLEYIRTGDAYQHSGGFDHEHPLLQPYVASIDGEPESITGLPKQKTKTTIELFLQQDGDK